MCSFPDKYSKIKTFGLDITFSNFTGEKETPTLSDFFGSLAEESDLSRVGRYEDAEIDEYPKDEIVVLVLDIPFFGLDHG